MAYATYSRMRALYSCSLIAPDLSAARAWRTSDRQMDTQTLEATHAW
jgi:hypothetical protein